MEQSEIQGLPEMWAVIELFGHQRAAGKLSTQNIGAVALIRLDVPEVTRKERSYDWGTRAEVTHEVTTPAHTRFFGVGAIYSINPCSEETARAELARIGNPPIVQMEVECVKIFKAPPEAIEAPPSNITLGPRCPQCGAQSIRKGAGLPVCVNLDCTQAGLPLEPKFPAYSIRVQGVESTTNTPKHEGS